MKHCRKCNQEKLVEFFYKNGKTKDGYQTWCKECQHDNQRQRKDYRAEWMREKRKEVTEYMRSLKDKPCADCGVHYPTHIMQFDHLDPNEKEYELGSIARQLSSFESIKAEADKCEVVCANCHLDREFKRRRSIVDE